MLMGNPLIRNDELELISKFGLEYANPEKMTVPYFDDDTHLEFWSDLDRTCASMAKVSPQDADNFRRFCTQVDQTMDLLVMGMYSVPPSPGMQAMMMDATPEGQEMVRLQEIRALDLVCEGIATIKIKV